MLGRALIERIDKQERAEATHSNGFQQFRIARPQPRSSAPHKAPKISASVCLRFHKDRHFVAFPSGGDRDVMEVEGLGRTARSDNQVILAGENRVDERLIIVSIGRDGQERWQLKSDDILDPGHVQGNGVGCSANFEVCRFIQSCRRR